uniref:Kazal-like domain-containing protein n=1 Tax=Homalodisca liturata TaxID=320908 RepID=A0A1B6IC76_9HEMI
MASILFKTLLVTACLCVCLATALPSKKDSYGSSAKKATSTTTKPPKPKCDTACPDDYTPICANEKGSSEKAKSFGNICVMNKYNCEHGTNLEKESDGECKNGSGVRLA